MKTKNLATITVSHLPSNELDVSYSLDRNNAVPLLKVLLANILVQIAELDPDEIIPIVGMDAIKLATQLQEYRKTASQTDNQNAE